MFGGCDFFLLSLRNDYIEFSPLLLLFLANLEKKGDNILVSGTLVLELTKSSKRSIKKLNKEIK